MLLETGGCIGGCIGFAPAGRGIEPEPEIAMGVDMHNELNAPVHARHVVHVLTGVAFAQKHAQRLRMPSQ